MSQSQIDILQRALKREKAARNQAEKILEEKSKKLYSLSKELKNKNNRLEDLLNEKTSQLQGVFNTFLDAYVVMNLKGHVIQMNDPAKDLFGYDIDKERLSISSLIYKDDEKYAFDSFVELTNKGFFHNYTARVITKSKEIKWVQINASVIYDVDKNPIAAQGIVRDITQDKIDANLLLESKNRLASLIENLDSGVLLEDENNTVILTNNKYCDLFKLQLTPEKLIGFNTENLADTTQHLFEKPKKFVERINELLNDKEEVLGEEILLADGTVLERNFIPILKKGEYNGHLWSYKDISLKKKYNQSLEAQKNKFSNIVANMNLGLVEINKKGKIVMVNQSVCEMSGYQEKDVIGKKLSKLFPSDNDDVIKTIKKQHKKRKKGESNSYELKVTNKNNKAKHWLISGAPNYNLKGDFIGTIAICLDITELKTLEKQKEKILQELAKSNDELQEYAHIVSHDLKSPLRSINALTSWIKSDNKGKFDEMTLNNFDLIETTLEKMEHLISDILIYSSAGSKTKTTEKVNLQELVEDLKKILYIPKHISVTTVKKLPTVCGDKTKFQQLFQNLISNAVKFCDKEEGIVEIDVTKNKSFYEFSIKDNGIGIEKKYHKKIFKIFNSLQESKSSTGIGLSIVKKIIDLYKGEIWLESMPGKGTIFFFTLKKEHGKT